MERATQNDSPEWRYQNEALSESGRIVVGRSHRSKESHNPEAGLAALKMVDLPPDNAAARVLGALRDYVIYAPSTETLRGLVPDLRQREPVGLSGGRLPEAVRELLVQREAEKTPERNYYKQVCKNVLSLIDWAQGYGARPRSQMPLSPSVPSARLILSFRDKYMSSARNTITGYDASEGALYVLHTAVLAAHPGVPSFFAIDNFDHGINPRLARALMKKFCKWVVDAPVQRQALLTTHNPLILDGLDLTDDRIRLFAVDRTTKGHTVVKRVVVDKRLLKKAKEGWNLSRLWVMGMIGGVPNV